jgi:hypothetical protein
MSCTDVGCAQFRAPTASGPRAEQGMARNSRGLHKWRSDERNLQNFRCSPVDGWVVLPKRVQHPAEEVSQGSLRAGSTPQGRALGTVEGEYAFTFEICLLASRRNFLAQLSHIPCPGLE